MAITTNASHVPTLTEFIDHWSQVDEEREAAGPLVLSTGGTRIGAAGMRTELQAIELELQRRLNDQQLARGQMLATKTSLLYWFSRWVGIFEAYFGASAWREARPLAPPIAGKAEDFVKPMLDVQDLWQRFNALTGGQVPTGLTVPIVLVGETSEETLVLADWIALIAALRLAADDDTRAVGRAKRSRSKRNFTQEQAYALMKLYRQAMPSSLPSGSTLQSTLPRLTPEDTGTTPEPVNASAVHVSGATSKTVHDASTAADLKEYQLRGVIGEEWDEDDAVTIATHSPEQAREFNEEFGLTQPGTAIVLKVYVITTTGRERGSAPMKVERAG